MFIGVVGKFGKLTLEISDEPMLGTWVINVEINGRSSEKNFEVKKYGTIYYIYILSTLPMNTVLNNFQFFLCLK